MADSLPARTAAPSCRYRVERELGGPTTASSGPYSDEPEWSLPPTYDVNPDGPRFLVLKRSATDVHRQMVMVTGPWVEPRARVAGAEQ